jgi:putative tryptophan/tyrosine transport system substrate-binding protein
MKRREFVTLLGGAAAAQPLGARAEQATKVLTIGYLGAATSATENQRIAAFVQRLRELHWVDGGNVAIEFRWTAGRPELLVEVASEFVKSKVDVIVTSGTPAVLAAKAATSVIPIVFAVAADPVGNKLVSSLAHPDGNVTGLSLEQTDLSSKRLEFLHEVVPTLRRLAIIGNVSNPSIPLELSAVRVAASTLGLDVVTLEIRSADDIAPAFEACKGCADALYVATDPLVVANRIRINTFALTKRFPTAYNSREYVELGGLMSYGANIIDLFRRAADFVDKVLRGANPGDIPVEQPTKFELVINLTTAKALGLVIPQSLLTTAEVIE